VDVLRTFESFSSSVWADETEQKRSKKPKQKKTGAEEPVARVVPEEQGPEQEEYVEEEEEEGFDDGMDAVYETEENFGRKWERNGIEIDHHHQQKKRKIQQFMPRYA
jgi:hypothetical protein